jgi:comEA protein
LNPWERWTAGEKAVVLLFATGLVAVVVATAIRSLPTRTPDIRFYEAPGVSSQQAPAPEPAVSVEQPESAPTPAVQQPPAAAKINVNTASAKELEALPGIGPVTAAAIVEYRIQNGPFVALEQLLDVKGIGPKKLEQILPQITL